MQPNVRSEGPNVGADSELRCKRLWLDALIRAKNGLSRSQFAKQVGSSLGLNDSGREIQTLNHVSKHLIGKNEITRDDGLEDTR